MKYITFQLEDKSEEIIIFPIQIDHDVIAEACSRLKNRLQGNWKRNIRTPISAGFIDMITLTCYGKSVGLNLKARPEDTKLLKEQRNETPR